MLKKILFFTAFVATSAQSSSLDTFQAQRYHLATQMNSIKRSFNSERLHIKMAKKASPVAYEATYPVFEKLLSDANINSKIENDITSQANAIVNDNASFASTKSSYLFSDFFPNLLMHEYGQKLFSAMANKHAYFLLGQKLAQKIAELDLAISMAQQPAGT